MTLRLCYTKTDALFWTANAEKAAGGEFTGRLPDPHPSPVSNQYVSLLLMITPNLTVQSEENFVNVEHQRKGHAGCLGRLQQNQSDLIATESLYPTIGQNLTNGPVVNGDKTAFLSAYSNEFPLRYADIMQSFDAFSAIVWFMIILSALFIMLMISCSNVFWKSQRKAIKKCAKQKRLLEERNRVDMKNLRGISAPSIMTYKTEKKSKLLVRSLMLLYYSLIKRSFTRASRSSLFVATLTLMLLILSFYVSFFFMAIVKTDKVVMIPPPTIQSYDDIINSHPRMRLAFFENIDSHLPFMKADAGSKEARIWQNVMRAGMNKTFVRDYLSTVAPFSKSEVIYFAQSSYIKFIASFYCKIRKQLEMKTIPMGQSDESATENIFVFVLSRHLSSATTARVMQVYGRLLPSGFANGVLAQAHRDKGTTNEDFDVCLSNVIRFPDQQFSGISLNQCRKLIMTVVALSVISSIVCLLEVVSGRQIPILTGMTTC